MEPPAPGSHPPVEEEDRVEDPASNASSNGDGAPTAAAPPPPPATPLHLDQAGGGADGSTSATVVDPRKGKEPLLPGDTPPPPSPADSAGGGADGSSSAAAWVERKGRLAAVPFPAPFPPSSAGSIPDFGAGGSSSSAGRRMVVPRDATGSFDYMQVVREGQSVVIEEGEEEQVESPHAKHALPGKEKEKLRQVKVRPRPEKGKSPWSWLKNKTQPISEVRNRYMVSSNGMNSLDGYSEFRPEQVIDRPDTDEERRLLDVVETASARHADLRWNSKFPRTSRAFKKLLEKVKRWKNTESTSSFRKEELLKFFTTYDKTQDIFAFLRLLVAIQICSHSAEYVPHIPNVASGVYSLKVWCFLYVTPARVESEGLMMRALASALDVTLIVETFQGGYARDIYTGPGVPRPAVTLLYNGNHYDIIYPHAPPSESSSHQAFYARMLAQCGWCFLYVTPARVESEGLMMRALASALDVTLIVETFQGGYARDIYTGPGVPRPAVTLLYNGNHYDIIYPHAPPSESSSHQAS
uniref:Uncharacterized protein n=1 Tax=Aegilops tauschii TaxID=37682 RepID=M8AWY1_AEGTA